MVKGPNTLTDLYSNLLKFRRYKFLWSAISPKLTTPSRLDWWRDTSEGSGSVRALMKIGSSMLSTVSSLETDQLQH